MVSSDQADSAWIFGTLAATAAVKYAFSVYTRWNKLQRFEHVGRVSSLNIFPVKSCGGISVDEGRCTQLGLRIHGVTDRHWLVIKANGDFLTQRQLPKMALIKISIHGDLIYLEAPGFPTLKLPKHPAFVTSSVVKCRVWLWQSEGQDCGEEASRWLSKVLEEDGLRLLFSAPELPKREANVEVKVWGNPALPGDQSAFSDFSAYMLLTEESIADLNSRLKAPVTVHNFRPNILIKADKAFDEDTWQEIRIGDTVYMRILDHCARCLLPTVDPNTGVRSLDGEPLETLKRFRRFKTYGSTPIFGVNAAVDVEGKVKVGDPVYAIRRSDTAL